MFKGPPALSSDCSETEKKKNNKNKNRKNGDSDKTGKEKDKEPEIEIKRENLFCSYCGSQQTSVTAFYRHMTNRTHMWMSLRGEEGPSVKVGNLCVKVPPFLCWDEEGNERAVLVTNLGPWSTPASVLLHFARFGFVLDYIPDPHGNFVVLRYLQRSAAAKVLEDSGLWRVDGTKVRARRKDDISLLEWTVLLELDGTYEKEDQAFFIRHSELMLSLQDLPFPLQFLNFVEKISVSEEDILLQKSVFQELCIQLCSIFPNMIFNLTKPQVPNISLENPVLEIFMDPFGTSREKDGKRVGHGQPPLHHAEKFQGAIAKIRYVLANAIKSKENKNLISKVASLPDDKFLHMGKPVDALVFHHFDTGVQCKISFDDPFSTYVGSLLEVLLQSDPTIVPVIKFMRYWARVLRFTQKKPEFTAMLDMMLLVYFMKANVIPSVKALQKLARVTGSEQQFQDGWRVDICSDVSTIKKYLRKRGKIRHEWEVGNETEQEFLQAYATEESQFHLTTSITWKAFYHIKNFFGIYAWNNFRETIVSPFLGDLVPKSVFFEYSAKRPASSSPAISPATLSPEFRLSDSPLIVQHPFDLSRNLGVGCDEVLVNRMQLEFRYTFRRIVGTLSRAKPVLGSMFPSFHVLLGWEPKKDVRGDKEEETRPKSTPSSCSISPVSSKRNSDCEDSCSWFWPESDGDWEEGQGNNEGSKVQARGSKARSKVNVKEEEEGQKAHGRSEEKEEVSYRGVLKDSVQVKEDVRSSDSIGR